MKKQDFDYFIFVDFEATCIKDMRINPQEIIEFPAIFARVTDKGLEYQKEDVEDPMNDEFHKYVKPVFRPKLSPFCIKLTGITQDKVDNADHFASVYFSFLDRLRKLEIPGKKAVFVTCGSWDLETMLPNQCELSQIVRPQECFNYWVDLKKEYARIRNTTISRMDNDLMQMMEKLGLEHEGRLHSGRDDVRNMVKVAEKLCMEGVLQPREQNKNWNRIFPNIVIGEQDIEPMDTSGDEAELKPDARIAESLKKSPKPIEQNFDFFFVLDFEATCLKDMRINPQEIIEFPCALYSVKDGETIEMFHHYIRPIHRPRLSPFCVKLTKITQGVVDSSEDFESVFGKFERWLAEMKEKHLATEANSIFVTCGDWDLKTMLPAQLELAQIEKYPDNLKRWVNIKKIFQDETGLQIMNSKEARKTDLEQMLEKMGIVHQGTIHSGIDDVKNIAKLVHALSRLTQLRETYSVGN